MSKPFTFFVLGVAWAFFFSVSSGLAQDSPDYRTWTDATGKFTIEAIFEKFEDGKVHLKRKDNGQVITLAMKSLSDQDQTHIRQLLAEARKAEAASKPVPERAAPANDASGPMVWQGNWNNRKFGTSGTLKCTAIVKDDKTWDAKFDGIGLGKPFAYQVTISTSKKGNRTLLQGTSTVDGDTYRWTGYVEGNLLVGNYRSGSGNNGEFRLQEARD